MINTARSRPVEIIGGGLAGLGLALGLRQRDVPVVLHEAGRYPRHRVCGEFITSLDATTIERLALAPHLHDARLARGVTWFRGHRAQLVQTLPEPALCLSRHRLDERLVRAALRAGATVHEDSRRQLPPAEGRVLAHGRRPAPASPWVGLSQHVRGFPLTNDLELHLGHRAYVGLARIEDDLVNVCGLFHRDNLAAPSTAGASPLDRAMRGAGLTALADRIAAADPLADSACSVAGLAYDAPPVPLEVATPSLGDHFGLIPPFTGNGMTVAFQSAALAVPHLADWSRGQLSWSVCVERIAADLTRELAPKLARARRLHPFILSPVAQPCLATFARLRLLPMRTLYRLLH